MDNYELNKKDETWRLIRQGGDRAIKTFDTKNDGLDFSTQYMRDHGGSLKIKKGNGAFQEERTYPRSADPRKTKG